MSALTMILAAVAALLCVASLSGVYQTNVTVRACTIPRWVYLVGGIGLLAATAAVISHF